jgi:hypothetical protein
VADAASGLNRRVYDIANVQCAMKMFVQSAGMFAPRALHEHLHGALHVGDVVNAPVEPRRRVRHPRLQGSVAVLLVFPAPLHVSVLQPQQDDAPVRE